MVCIRFAANRSRADHIVWSITRKRIVKNQGRFLGHCRAGAAITAAHRAKVEPLDHLHHEASQMLLRQPLVNRWRQQ